MIKSKNRETWYAYFLCLPLLIYLALILFVPMLKGISMSFTNKRIGGVAEYIGLTNYKQVLASPDFWHALVVTLLFTALSIFFKAIAGLLMAVVLNRDTKMTGISRALLLIPWTLPNIVVVLNWRWIFSDIGGVANYILKSLNFISKDLVWFGKSSLAFFCIVLVNVWRGTPFFGISILSQMQTIPEDHYEAAEIDGANVWQQFRYITFPAIKDVLSLSALMSMIWTLNEFETVWLLTGGGPNHSTEVINVYSYLTAMSSMQLGKGITISVLSMPILIILIVLISRKMFEEQ